MNKKIIQSTPHGPVGIIWTPAHPKPRIARIMISSPEKSAAERVAELFPKAKEAPCDEIGRLAKDIIRMLKGNPVDFSLELADMTICSPFQKKVLAAVHRIPRGKVSTYGRIAKIAGSPGASRAVGTIMATNPFPIMIPCHRVVRINGFAGRFGGGAEMKIAMLKKEGIAIDDRGRIPEEMI